MLMRLMARMTSFVSRRHLAIYPFSLPSQTLLAPSTSSLANLILVGEGDDVSGIDGVTSRRTLTIGPFMQRSLALIQSHDSAH